MNNNILYLPMTDKETRIGWVCVLVYSLVCLLLRFSYWAVCLFAVGAFIALAVLYRDFFRRSVDTLALLPASIWLKPLLSIVLNTVICTVLNDLLLFYEAPYFIYTGWGPSLWNIQAAIISTSVPLWLMGLIVVVVLPVVEELLFRGVIFGSIYPKSVFWSFVLSIGLFAMFQTQLFTGFMDDSMYFAIYFFQFVPMGLFLCWLYRSTNSIFSPILMHMLSNALLLMNLSHY